MNEIRLAIAAAVTLRADTNAPLPTRIKVLGWGRNETSEGVVIVDELTAKVFAANQKAIGREQVALDFEHNTVPGTPEYQRTNEPRAIAGYTNLVCIPGEGIYGEALTYTATGEKSAADFKDLSLAPYLDADGRVIAAHSVGLTRTGATYGISFTQAPGALAASEPCLCADLKILSAANPAATPKTTTKPMSETMIKLTVLAAALGLAETADEGAVSAELKKRLTIPAPEKVDLAPLTARLEKVEGLLTAQANALAAAESGRLVALFATEGKAPINPETKAAYTVAELAKLDLPTLEVLHANTPITVPLAGRRALVDANAKDPNLKGRARFVAAQEAENQSGH